MNVEKILDAARETGAEAVHPGYGFFSENAGFARAVAEAGMVFIGPPPDAIVRMGDKVEARKLMAAAGVPVVPGSPGTLESEDEVRAVAKKIGFPIMLKAAAGGGGKGMRLVENEKDLALGGADGRQRGQIVVRRRPLLRREIRHAAAPYRDSGLRRSAGQHGPSVRARMFDSAAQSEGRRGIAVAVRHARDARMRWAKWRSRRRARSNYVGAGTIEFLADADRNFYFLEMNTRIQVEHPVTELVTGTDLVKTQIEVAAGAPLPFKQSDLAQRGWALECRIYAEDPAAGFVPAPGKISTMRLPDGPGVRVDAGVYEGAEVSLYYDPMIAKLATWGRDRQ